MDILMSFGASRQRAWRPQHLAGRRRGGDRCRIVGDVAGTAACNLRELAALLTRSGRTPVEGLQAHGPTVFPSPIIETLAARLGSPWRAGEGSVRVLPGAVPKPPSAACAGRAGRSSGAGDRQGVRLWRGASWTGAPRRTVK